MMGKELGKRNTKRLDMEIKMWYNISWLGIRQTAQGKPAKQSPQPNKC